MTKEDFQKRVARIQARTGDAEPVVTETLPRSGGFVQFVLGCVLSFLIWMALMNIQAISDAAPKTLMDATAPGILGLVVAVIGVLWIVAVPGMFIRQFLGDAIAGRGGLPRINFRSGGVLGFIIGVGLFNGADVLGRIEL